MSAHQMVAKRLALAISCMAAMSGAQAASRFVEEALQAASVAFGGQDEVRM